MAESGLSIGASDLRAEIGYFLGYGRTSGNWSAAQLSEINGIMQSGVRRVYYPVGVSDDTLGYEWSWLRPTTTLELYDGYSTGTVTVVSGVVTLAGGTWPSWAAAGSITIDSTEYTVDTRDSDSQITLDDLTVNEAAGTTYSLVHDGDYDLPDNFGRLVGGFHYPKNEYRADIVIVSVSKLLAMRAYSDLDDAPNYAAIRFKESDRTTGQRQEVLFYPRPNDSWILSYEYEAYSGTLTDSYPYTLGGMQLAELFIESCLAVAENRFGDELGQHNQQYAALLRDAIARDKKRGPRFFGQMGNVEGIEDVYRRHGDTGGQYDITYKGVTY